MVPSARTAVYLIPQTQYQQSSWSVQCSVNIQHHVRTWEPAASWLTATKKMCIHRFKPCQWFFILPPVISTRVVQEWKFYCQWFLIMDYDSVVVASSLLWMCMNNIGVHGHYFAITTPLPGPPTRSQFVRKLLKNHHCDLNQIYHTSTSHTIFTTYYPLKLRFEDSTF